MSHTEELIRKTLTTSRFFAGGSLNAEQLDRYIQIVRSHGGFLKDVTMVKVSNGLMDLDKAHLGEPITEGAPENDDPTTVTYHSTKHNKVSISVTKLRAAYYITTEVLQRNLEQNGYEDTLISMMAERHAFDIELLAVQGDDSIAGATPMDKLLKVKDGWDIQTESAIILNAAGAEIQKGLFHAAWDMMPRHFRRMTQNLRWIMNRSLWNDYMDRIADRPDALGGTAVAGKTYDGNGGISPMGIQPLFVDTIPDFKDVIVDDATYAHVVATRQGPFEITTGTNDKFKVDVDNAGPVTVTFTQGVHSTNEIAYQINVALAALIASTDVDGHLVLTSTTTGAASEIDIQAQATSAYSTLGSTIAVTIGVAAGAGGTEDKGTFMWLADPRQFIWAILDKTRIFAEYQKNIDRIETVIYDQMDFKVQELEGIVKVTNIKRRQAY